VPRWYMAFVGLKTHAKLSLVIRREADKNGDGETALLRPTLAPATTIPTHHQALHRLWLAHFKPEAGH